jgi:hypothetical protein
MIDRWFDGLGASGELDRRLAEDPAFADAFVKAARRDQALVALFREERAVSRFRALAPRRRVWIATAVAALLLGLFLLRGDGVLRGPHVQRWDDGTTVTLFEGAEMVVVDDDPKILELRAGELEADVAPQKAPMVLRTPEAEAVVLGTKFRLSTKRLEVSEGRVRFAGRDVVAGQVAYADKVVAKEADRFLELYRKLHDPRNGYFSPEGVPYHAAETLVVDAPDHGHLTTSETFSYWLWLEAAHGRVTGDWAPFRKAWRTMEAVAIPSPADQPHAEAYRPEAPHEAMPEKARIEDYPVGADASIPVGTDPLALPGLHVMHWLIDADNVYGFGRRGDRRSRNGFVNTFQRGPHESVWETIPHPSWDDRRDGGYVGYFVKSDAPQWRYVCAPDADARAIQAAYWARAWAPPGTDLPLASAARMGDGLRYALQDKHFRGRHGLIGWAFGWGGSLDPRSRWAWRSGAGQAHVGYQNPLAAWALATVPELRTASGAADWKESVEAQLQMFRELQSAEGAVAGGYAIRDGTLAFDAHPVFLDPPSNEWFGWQAWSMDRLAQYALVSSDARAKDVVARWAAWAKAEVRLTSDGGYAIPGELDWSGAPGTLRVKVRSTTEDVGVAGATARALAFWAAASGDGEARALAQGLLERIWRRHGDAKGVSNPERFAAFRRFHEKVHVPDGVKGPVRPGATFLGMRPWFTRDRDWGTVEEALRRGEPPTLRLHRFWAQVEVAVANAEFARLFAP